MSAILVAGVDPLLCIRSYCRFYEMKDPSIINKLVIDAQTKHLADHAVKFRAFNKKDHKERIFIGCFKRAEIMGIYLTSVKELF